MPLHLDLTLYSKEEIKEINKALKLYAECEFCYENKITSEVAKRYIKYFELARTIEKLSLKKNINLQINYSKSGINLILI